MPAFNTPFNGRRDPSTLRLTYRRCDGTWYLEWHAASAKTNAVPTQRRKAHDTEVTLIERIRVLERQLAGTRPVADLKLRPITNLKRITTK